MAVQVEKLLGPRLCGGCISIPFGTSERFAGNGDFSLSSNTTLEVIECARNNLPDETALIAASKIKHIAQTMTPEDVLCVLISGGGSALLCLPKDPITLQEKLRIIKSLSTAGAAIDELNYVRIALSAVKGGQLALEAANAYRVYSYVISDIVGDPVPLIASGPTVLTDRVRVNEKAMEILVKYKLWDSLPSSVVEVMARPADQEVKAGPENNELFLLGSNELAVRCIVEQARTRHLKCIVLSKRIEGNVSDLSAMYVELTEILYNVKIGVLQDDITSGKLQALLTALGLDDSQREAFISSVTEWKHQPLLIVGAGEPTVCVAGDGKGGRNQELALRFSYGVRQLANVPDSVCFLSAGTDGIDGPTDAAGAIGGGFVALEYDDAHGGAMADGTSFIERNDSYSFYEALGGGKYFVKTGHTGTNVMDLHLLLIDV
uniref:Glycerate kinase n=1 Tax=Anopheles dirus TaxID=7168 RepID=A0A182NTL7_9DIPT